MKEKEHAFGHALFLCGREGPRRVTIRRRREFFRYADEGGASWLLQQASKQCGPTVFFAASISTTAQKNSPGRSVPEGENRQLRDQGNLSEHSVCRCMGKPARGVWEELFLRESSGGRPAIFAGPWFTAAREPRTKLRKVVEEYRTFSPVSRYRHGI